MKILAIRGRNLASFEGDFELDFSQGKLASSSLYSIVGPTGSGKSTILDALCLALFGRTPRMAGDRSGDNTRMADQSGESIGLNDPRMILRRDCKEGYASVDFVGVNGNRYQAKWEIRRRRGHGVLDTANHSYTDLERATSTSIASRTRDQQILGYLGLSYEQFCRSVLLPQGDFAAFLRAKPEERADLLEALTGTEIYSEISKQAYQKSKSYQDQIDALQAQLNNFSSLSDEEIAVKKTELQAKMSELQDLHAALNILDGNLEWHSTLAALQTSLAQAQISLAQRESEQQALLPLVTQVEQFHKAQKVQVEFEQWKDRRNQKRQSSELQSTKKNLLSEVQEKLMEVSTQVGILQSELDHAKREREQALPKIEQAAALDSQIQLIEQNRQNSSNQVQKRQVSLSVHDQKIKEQQQNLDQVQMQLNQLQAQIEQAQQSGLDLLAQDWSLWNSVLGNASQLISQKSEAQKNIDQAHANLQRFSAEHAVQNELLQNLEKTVQDLVQTQSEIDTELRSFNQRELQENRNAQQETLHHLKVQKDKWGSWFQSEQKCSNLQSELNSKLQILETTTQASAAKKHQYDNAHHQLSGMQALASLELALESRIAEIRHHLVDGEACPVCGSESHPFAADQKWIEEIRSAKEARSQLESEVKSLEHEHRKLELDRVAQQSAIESTQKLLTEQTQSEKDLQNALADLGITDAKQCNGPEFDRQIKDCQDRLSLCDQMIEHFDKLTARKSNVDQSIQSQTLELQAKRDLLGRSTQKMDLEKQSLENFNQRLSEIERDLSEKSSDWDLRFGKFPSLAWVTLVPDLKDALLTLQRSVAEYNRYKVDAEQLQKNAQTTDQEIKNLIQIKDLQSIELASAQKELAEIELKQRTTQQERVSIWPEADLQISRQKLSEQVEHREKSLLASQEQINKMLQEKSALNAEIDTLEQQISALTQQIEQGRTQLLQTMDKEQLFVAQEDNERLTNLHQCLSESDKIASYEAQINSSREQLTQSRTIVTERQEQLSNHEQGKSLEFDAQDPKLLQENRRLLQDKITAEDEVRQAIVTALQMHDMMLDLQGNLIRQKTALLQEQAVWKELNELIGSSDGRKFRLYAQQFTLSILVHQANQQLERINRRYKLDREPNSLAIVVVDRDMGDSRRSLNSLSGGESFLVSLGLALGLSALSGTRASLESLFIDEGFGTLDPDTLRVAMDALDALQAQGRKVGIITHVEELKERILTQVRVVKTGNRSKLEVVQ